VQRGSVRPAKENIMQVVPGDGAAGQESHSSHSHFSFSLGRGRAWAIRSLLFVISTIALALIGASEWSGTAHAARLSGLLPGRPVQVAVAVLPPVDTDGDGMPDEWEAFFGLNPNDPSDATADPDGDGLTNLQEYQQGGHPFGTQKRYLAEGALGFFRTDIGLVNSSTSVTAKVLLTYLTETGTRYSQRVELAPMQRRTVSANDFLTGVTGGISTIIESNVPVAADRFMQWGATGYGSSLSNSVAAPSQTWYFAEGATGIFQLYYLLLNPANTTAHVSIKYLQEVGPPVTRTYTVPAHTRATIAVNSDLLLLFSSMGAAISSDVPIVAERSMYLSSLFEVFTAGAAGAGSPQLATEWIFAEGSPGGFFDEFLLLANPNPSPTTLSVTYRRADGVSATAAYAVPGQGRTTVWVNHEMATNPALAPVANSAISMVVSARVKIVAERTMWWPRNALSWYESATSLGATQPALNWTVTEGSVGGSQHEQTFVLVTNADGTTAGQVRLTSLSDAGTTNTQTLPIPAAGRITVDAATFGLSNTHVSVFVDSVGPNPVPLVVEYSRYGSSDFRTWSAGGTTLATPRTVAPPVDTAPTVTATDPANNATNVPFDGDLTVTFSEPVNVTPAAFTLECPVGTGVTLTNLTASPATTFHLHPTAHLPFNTACKLVIHAAAVTDTDTVDPPDAMLADVIVLFTTGACPAIVVSPSSLAAASAGSPYTPVQFTQTGGTTPIVWSIASGTLPAGMTLTNAGLLSGTPTATGSFSITVRATDANGCFGERTLTVNVSCPTITVAPSALSDALVGAAYGPVQFTQTGSPTAVTWTLQTGTLPAGMALSAGGVLSGTPTATGSFTVTVRATDANGCFGEVTVTLHVNCPTITVNPATIADAIVGAVFPTVNFTQTGSTGAPTFSVTTGTVPAGLTLSTAGVLSGTPTATGLSSFTVTAADQYGCSGSRALTLQVNCPTITVSPSTVSDALVGAAYTPVQFTQSGSPTTVTWTVQTGTLPAGMALSAGGLLSGTPTATGTFTVTVRATNTNGCFGEVTITFHVTCPTITVNPATLADATVGNVFPTVNFTQTGSNGTPTFSVTTGTLPGGLTLSTAGALSGTPTATGLSSFTITAADQYGCSGARALTLQINCPTITVSPGTLTAGVAGVAYGPVNFSQTGGHGAITFTLQTGTLPTGVTLTSAGVLSGTPTQTGSFSITVRATDANGCFGEVSITWTINCPVITITNPGVNTGLGGVAFSQTFTQTGATSPVFSLNSGTLPTGLTLSTAGVLSGTPTQTGVFPITVKVSGSFGCSGTGSTYTLTIQPNAVDDTYPEAVLGNVPVDSSILGYSVTANDIFSGTVTITTASPITTAHGGTVAIVTSGANIGRFTYNPPRGYTGSDTFSYTVSDGSSSDSATVSFTVAGMPWFINNNAGICSSSCDGRLTNPYVSLAAFQADNGSGTAPNPKDNDPVFVFESATHYTGGALTLRGGQKLLGQDATAASFAALTGLTIPASSAPVIPTLNAANGTLVQIDASSGNVVALGSGNTVRGLTINTTGSGATGLSGASVGAFTASDASVLGSGRAVSLSNGALNATFHTLSSSGGVTGITLSNTTGTFTVTGDGATAGTGGTLSGGSPNVSLSSAAGISLNHMVIQNGGTNGITGATVSGLTLHDVTVQNNGNVTGEHGASFTELTGTVTVSNSTFTGAADDNFVVTNTGGTLGLTVTASTFSNNSSTVAGENDGLLLKANNTSSITANVSGSTFTANRGDHFQAAAANSANLNITFDNNTLSGGNASPLGQGITINAATGVPGYSGSVTYSITNNHITGAILSAIITSLGTSSAAATMSGVITGNTIGNATAASGSVQAFGIDVEQHGNGTHSVRVQNNTIQHVNDRGIFVLVTDGNGAANVNVFNNTVSAIDGAFGREGFYVEAGATTTNVFGLTDNQTVCVGVGGSGLANTLAHGTGSTDEFRLRQRFNTTIRLPGYAGGAADTAAVIAFVSGNNNAAAGSATVSGTGGGFTNTASCSTP
jgi:hypothetical protein